MQKRKFSNERLFKRFSQITGIPLSEIYPKIGEDYNILKTIFGFFGEYVPLTNVQRMGKIKSQYIKEHETRHALLWHSKSNEFNIDNINFLMSEKKKKRKKKDYIEHGKDWIEEGEVRASWNEPTNADPRKNIFMESFVNMFASPKINALLLSSITMRHFNDRHSLKIFALAAFLALPKYLRHVKRQKLVRDLFFRHGEDALLLLWVYSPQKLDALEIPKWEQEVIEKGYLLSNGGLTKKGLWFWRKQLQPASVWHRLAVAAKTRAEKGIKVVEETQKKIRRPRSLERRKHLPK